MKIEIPEKILTPELVQVFEALKPNECRIVGGVVRDLIANVAKEEPDIDIATTATPDVVTKKLENAGIKAVPTGLEHGTITAVVGSKTFEITTLRKDIKTDGRHAVVEFTTDFEEDAARRDFTFNALYLDLNGEVTDFYDGVEDLKKGTVKFIGDAEQRIREDYLRIMRYFRFYSRFGKSEPDEATLKTIHELAAELDNLSEERVTQELMKILQTSHPARAWALMLHTGVLDAVGLDGRDDDEEMEDRHSSIVALEVHTKLFSESRNPVERFVCLFGLYSMLVAEQGMLKLSKKHLRFIGDLVDALNNHSMSDGVEDVLYNAGDEEIAAALLRIMATEAELAGEEVMRNSFMVQLEELAEIEMPEFPLTGSDVMELGIEPGPMVGEILGQIEDWWQETGYPEREDCLTELKRLISR